MNILFITNIPSPYRIDFFNELGKEYDVKVIFEATKAPNTNKDWYSQNYIKNFEAIFLKDGEIKEKKVNWKILKYLKGNKNDIVIVTNYAYFTEMMALIYLKLRRIPYFLEVDGGTKKIESRIKKVYKTLLIAGAYGYLSPSVETDESLIYYGAKKEKIYRYPFTSLKSNDIQTETISSKEKDDLKKELSITAEKVVLSIGRFIPEKGFDTLIKASKLLDEKTIVYIVGGVPTKEYLNLIKELNILNVMFINFQSKEQLKKYYKIADVFVLPTRNDVWGLVINEAMANGLPVITTNKCVAGLELIDNGINGYITSPDSPQEIAQAVNKILGDRHIQMNMSTNNLEKIKNYSLKNMAKRHSEIFKSITASSAR